jgi:hypothetical protein
MPGATSLQSILQIPCRFPGFVEFTIGYFPIRCCRFFLQWRGGLLREWNNRSASNARPSTVNRGWIIEGSPKADKVELSFMYQGLELSECRIGEVDIGTGLWLPLRGCAWIGFGQMRERKSGAEQSTAGAIKGDNCG